MYSLISEHQAIDSNRLQGLDLVFDNSVRAVLPPVASRYYKQLLSKHFYKSSIVPDVYSAHMPSENYDRSCVKEADWYKAKIA